MALYCAASGSQIPRAWLSNSARMDLIWRVSHDVRDIEMQPDFTIEREKKNIDLLISDKNNAVVINNRIKSSINGIDVRHDVYSDEVQSQLKNTINLLHLMMSIAIKVQAASFSHRITITLN